MLGLTANLPWTQVKMVAMLPSSWVKGVVTDRGHAERIVIMNGALLRVKWNKPLTMLLKSGIQWIYVIAIPCDIVIDQTSGCKI
jgi:thiosulfate reductase cytochrome b subunit